VASSKNIARFDRAREQDSPFTRTRDRVPSDSNARLFEFTIQFRGARLAVLGKVNHPFEGVLLQEQLSGFELNEHVTSMRVRSLIQVCTFHGPINFDDDRLKNVRQSERRVWVGSKAGM